MKINFGKLFNRELGENILQKCIDITFGERFNNGEKLFNCILPNCTEIYFDLEFKVPLGEDILQNIKNIIIYKDHFLKDGIIIPKIYSNNITKWLKQNQTRFNTKPVQTGGYYMKYIKYKNKYLQLKKNLL